MSFFDMNSGEMTILSFDKKLFDIFQQEPPVAL